LYYTIFPQDGYIDKIMEDISEFSKSIDRYNSKIDSRQPIHFFLHIIL
jgi:hypothetical protein